MNISAMFPSVLSITAAAAAITPIMPILMPASKVFMPENTL
jgi:hypothetical protein